MSEASHLLDLGSSLRQSGEDLTDVSTLLHRDDSELIFLVDPDEEGLLVVVEDTSTSRPVAVESTSLKEPVTLLEEEMVSDELVSLSISHGAERVELSLQLTLEAVAGLDDLLLDLVALFVGDTRAERVLCEITSDTDASGLDHCGLVLWEWWALKFGVVHVTNMLVGFLVAMVILDDLVKQRSEGSVRIMRACVNTDSRVNILATRENRRLEREPT